MHAPENPDDRIDTDILMLAYRSGIFPMADSREDPEIFWIEPRMRAILPLDGLHVSHSLARTLRRGRFHVTCNAAFSQVMEACAAPRAIRPDAEIDGEDDSPGGSWISHRIQRSYEALHAQGLAHSIECWRDDPESGACTLVGGLYGVGFDRAFCGESMFSRQRDASKVALCWLVAALQRCGAILLDCQFMTTHLASLGATEIPQTQYLKLLEAAQKSPRPSPSAYWTSKGTASEATGSEGRVASDVEATSLAATPLPVGFAALLDEAAGAEPSISPGKLIAQLLTQTS